MGLMSPAPESNTGIDGAICQVQENRKVVVVPNRRERCRGAIVGESGRNRGPGDSDLVVRSVRVLIASKKEKFVFYDRQTQPFRRPCSGATRDFFHSAGIFGSALKK